jgi:hypothetical protein
MIIYPFYGFNAINDVNVYSVSKLMLDPYADLDSITGEWVKAYFGSDSLLVTEMTRFLNASHEVLKEGLYISDFARYDVRALGLEPPPMLWIFEWDILGASPAVFSNIYYITGDNFREVLEEGAASVTRAIGLREILLSVQDRVEFHEEDFQSLIASVEYEIELFRLLNYYRVFFMHYYQWIDTGEGSSASGYKVALGQFKAMVDYHEDVYSDNLNTLGMDFEEARTGIRLAEKTPLSIRWARVVLVLILFMMVLGIPGFIRDRGHRRFAGTLYFDALFRPHRITPMDAWHSSSRLLGFLLTLYALALVIFSGFHSLFFPLVTFFLGLIYVLILTLFTRPGRRFPEVMVSLLAPKLAVMALVLLVVSIRGPQYFWYQFWISDLFRILFLTAYVMLLVRKFHVHAILSGKWTSRRSGGLFPVLVALGVQVLLAGVLLSYFGLEQSLTALNNEMLVLPAGLSKILGITTHLSIPPELPVWVIAAGSILTIGCLSIHILLTRRAGR